MPKHGFSLGYPTKLIKRRHSDSSLLLARLGSMAGMVSTAERASSEPKLPETPGGIESCILHLLNVSVGFANQHAQLDSVVRCSAGSMSSSSGGSGSPELDEQQHRQRQIERQQQQSRLATAHAAQRVCAAR